MPFRVSKGRPNDRLPKWFSDDREANSMNP